MAAMATKNCEWCGESYDRHRSFGKEQWAVSRFCSRQCRGEKIAIEVYYRRHKERFAGGLDKWRNERESIFKRHGWRVIFLDETKANKASVGREVYYC